MKSIYRFSFSLLIGILLIWSACAPPEPSSADEDSVAELEYPLLPAPEWSHDVVWYQIFAERFWNGDPSNDPTREDLYGAYPGFAPENWSTTPWTQDWYAPDDYWDGIEDWAKDNRMDLPGFDQKVQLRRYGGDLQGVFDRLDYLDSLGITAIYFNPLNDAPSLHKYDPRHWRHIDRNFGPDPEGDLELIAKENPADPSTWVMTAADQMFADLIYKCHKRGIRVILDYSWNHTGREFWAWKDLLENQEKSDYADWYWVKTFDDPATEGSEFEYRGWFGVPS